MRVIAKKTLREFWSVYPDCEQQLKAWYCEMERGSWRDFNKLREDFPSVSILRANRACFNIKGNTYRLIVRINFNYQIVWIRFIGTHFEYDKIDVNII